MTYMKLFMKQKFCDWSTNMFYQKEVGGSLAAGFSEKIKDKLKQNAAMYPESNEKISNCSCIVVVMKSNA